MRITPILVLLSIIYLSSSMKAVAAPSSEPVKLREMIVLAPGYSTIHLSKSIGTVNLEKGTRFPVSLTTGLDSSIAMVGDPVEATLLSSIVCGGKTILSQGTILKGWVSDVFHRRGSLRSQLSSTRWANSNAALKIHFDKIMLDGGDSISISADPAIMTPVKGSSSEFELGVNKHAEICLNYSRKKYTATSVAIGAVGVATGPLSLVVCPAISGAAGAIAPSYALDRPVSEGEDNRRVKGLVQGMVKGLPGGSVVLGAKHSGLRLVLDPGSQIYVELGLDLVLPKKVTPTYGPTRLFDQKSVSATLL